MARRGGQRGLDRVWRRGANHDDQGGHHGEAPSPSSYRGKDPDHLNGVANFENFYAGGEYARVSVDRLPILSGGALAFRGDNPGFSGWYVKGSWVITGEPKTYTVSATNNEVGGFGSPKVASPFSPSGHSWGAWELTARYSDTDLNWNESRIADPLTLVQSGIAGGEERVIMLGLNWYLNNNVKLQVNDGVTQVSKIVAPGTNVQVGPGSEHPRRAAAVRQLKTNALTLWKG